MKKIYYYILMGMFTISCTSPTEWLDDKDDIAPGPVTNVQVENLNGGARISYTLPSDDDLLGAKVVYSLTEGGEVLEKYASIGNNYIELEGFGNQIKSDITVHAVDKSGNVSSGVTKTIEPLAPPISLMRETLEAKPAFGGISLTWDNEFEKDMGVSLFVYDSETEELKLFDTYFSKSKNGKAVFRPFDPEKQQFHIEMFDRWNNYAEPMEASVTPMAEQKLPGREGSTHIWKLFDDNNWLYRGDIHNDPSSSTYSGRKFELVHDGRGQSNSNNTYWQPGDDGVAIEKYIPGTGSQLIPFPLYFTVDMGRKAIYSRFNIKPRLRSPNFSAPMPSDFEIWGTNNPKLTTEVGDGSREANMAYWTSWEQANGTDAWKNDGWTKIGTCKLTLSSGESKYYEGMTLSEEDVQNYRVNGFDFDMDDSITEGYQYLRWVIKDTNTGQRSLMICEITFWGSYTE